MENSMNKKAAESQESIREMAYRFNNEPGSDRVAPDELEDVINAAERYFGLPESKPE
jgi:hypothetical protein